ncbi:hypothetical protein TVAG_151000 [Trichomonas vaginalis G3]|uniref:Uncharacterized protein n=1 Tax=Trichomonas vaginalis (strain ATCC PRA-98 / G3) TaxID=412133 RepID=A2FM12_TRIV3|nr:armadillo (ARM) repeat-containing protein family [Trichomonas vaginalis G3]EAX94053.1 hypothetical protein TVAG_151000 [Trichomonas vaginalis G3]KAI5548217.1 armadillo (ARM) repeat-containing protein family [Trichomonas vaginalis G3]|eukprot:XP_001306983.1 hypothetical protein [Trichomonas vaginalis G3]
MTEGISFEEETLSQISILLDGIHMSDTADSFGALNAYLSEIKFPSIPEIISSRIIHEANRLIESSVDDDNTKLSIVTCIAFAFRFIPSPFETISETTILPYISMFLENEPDVPLLNQILELLNILCIDCQKHNYGEKALVLEYLQSNLLVIIYNIDIDEENADVLISVLSVIMTISHTINQTPTRYQSLFDLLILLLDSPLQISEKILEFLYNLLQKHINLYSCLQENDVTSLIEFSKCDSYLAQRYSSSILIYLTSKQENLQFFMDNGLFDILLTTIHEDISKKSNVACSPMFECIYNLSQFDKDLIEVFFQSDLLNSDALLGVPYSISKSLIKLIDLAIKNFADNPPFLNNIQLVVEVTKTCLLSDDKEIVMISLDILEQLIHQNIEVDAADTLACLSESEDPDLSERVAKLLEIVS